MVVSRICIRGAGAVSPAGWGVGALCDALAQNRSLPVSHLPCPGRAQPLRVRRVPPPPNRPTFAAHPRLRRTSPIGQYATAAALEALGSPVPLTGTAASGLGIVYCAMAGCVNFSRRFYDETLKNPATASPVIFPETVFNAPASHLGALLGTSGINYTLVGDPGTFLQGVALAADWLTIGRVKGCLVVGAEELDWLVAGALELFDPDSVASEGAGALYLTADCDGSDCVELKAITNAYSFTSSRERAIAARKARADLGTGSPDALLCDGLQAVRRLDEPELAAWQDWNGKRLSPKTICGEAFVASAAWQCVSAFEAISRQHHNTATVSILGINQQAIAARFERTEPAR